VGIVLWINLDHHAGKLSTCGNTIHLLCVHEKLADKGIAVRPVATCGRIRSPWRGVGWACFTSRTIAKTPQRVWGCHRALHGTGRPTPGRGRPTRTRSQQQGLRSQQDSTFQAWPSVNLEFQDSTRHRVGGFWGHLVPQQVSAARCVHTGCGRHGATAVSVPHHSFLPSPEHRLRSGFGARLVSGKRCGIVVASAAKP
jgi:hypothetical protein